MALVRKKKVKLETTFQVGKLIIKLEISDYNYNYCTYNPIFPTSF